MHQRHSFEDQLLRFRQRSSKDVNSSVHASLDVLPAPKVQKNRNLFDFVMIPVLAGRNASRRHAAKSNAYGLRN
jgi:hypothetical protein